LKPFPGLACSSFCWFKNRVLTIRVLTIRVHTIMVLTITYSQLVFDREFSDPVNW